MSESEGPGKKEITPVEHIITPDGNVEVTPTFSATAALIEAQKKLAQKQEPKPAEPETSTE